MKNIFDNTTLGNIEMKNRLIRSATWEGMADEEGHINDGLLLVYEGLAKGGVGAIITGFTSVADDDHYFGGMVRLSNDSLTADHKALTEIAHKNNCPVIVQLALGEYNGSYRDMSINDLTVEDIKRIKERFVLAAYRAEKAGYDGVQIHAAHGFFLSRFISPAYNHRLDEYGGSAANRGRIVAEIIQQIKRECPQLHITMKINCSDFMLGGLTPSDSLLIGKQCVNAGLDSIEVSGAGTSVPRIKPGVNEAYFKEFALALAEQIDVPVILVGGHRSMESMEAVLNEGRIAYLSLSRPLIREPDLPNRWHNGNTSPAKCVSCNMCYRTPAHQCVFNKK